MTGRVPIILTRSFGANIMNLKTYRLDKYDKGKKGREELKLINGGYLIYRYNKFKLMRN